MNIHICDIDYHESDYLGFLGFNYNQSCSLVTGDISFAEVLVRLFEIQHGCSRANLEYF